MKICVDFSTCKDVSSGFEISCDLWNKATFSVTPSGGEFQLDGSLLSINKAEVFLDGVGIGRFSKCLGFLTINYDKFTLYGKKFFIEEAFDFPENNDVDKLLLCEGECVAEIESGIVISLLGSRKSFKKAYCHIKKPNLAVCAMLYLYGYYSTVVNNING
ncbi:hypothetical protein [Pseudoteredinibacter isoporae]|uniref:Uncharacterized protein n=1 Tax=Pseudoteredinibacter isoporae TaxID=570281 RepID=A0A7X0JWB6_9GAMM|nr:hypothetical protein [Pseudoteredinibacter isoporae]MBB6523437.1 hypothetical protein [Pseudoteredinibacter isoporae]NHO88948.1 hypothetical protein [Pseudoteredinibacter isoporae]NIB24344.1 hypothetical protein [Pseudoteredinibacter isoporae]